jgi:hypothetical protein
MGIATQKENLDANDTLYDLFALVKKQVAHSDYLSNTYRAFALESGVTNASSHNAAFSACRYCLVDEKFSGRNY